MIPDILDFGLRVFETRYTRRKGMLLPRPMKLYRMLKARLRPPRVDEEIIRTVLTNYDLGKVKGYKQPAAGVGRSSSLIVQAHRGKKLLKCYKSTMSWEGIVYEHSVLRHLSVKGFPAPRLVVNNKGQTCTEVSGRYYALFDFITGFRYTDFITTNHRERFFLKEAGQALARYHQIMDGFVPAGRKLDGFMPDGSQRWRNHKWYQAEFEKYESLLDQKAGTELDRFFLQNIGRFKKTLASLSHRLEGHSVRLSRVVVHGDYGPYNLFFNGDGLVAVLDFECTHLDLRASEVISALWRFAGSRRGIDEKKAEVFFIAYQDSYPLTAEEIELMPDLFRLARLRGITMYLRDYFGSVGLPALRYARHAVWWMDWMEENRERLIQRLSAFQ